MQIRAAHLEDAAQICSVLRRSITELCVADHRDDPEILQPWLANKTEDNLRDWILREGQIYYVALIDDTIAGVGAVSAVDGVLLNYVSPDYQYRGVSKAIMAAIELWLVQQGQSCSRQHSTAQHSTATARSFYEKIGYVARAVSGKVGTGFPFETAPKQRDRAVLPLQEKENCSNGEPETRKTGLVSFPLVKKFE